MSSCNSKCPTACSIALHWTSVSLLMQSKGKEFQTLVPYKV